MSPTDLGKTLHRRQVSDGFLLYSVILLMVGLLGLAIVQGANAAADKGQGTAITQIKGEIRGLCLSGAIDCTGTETLPPPEKGAAGTGIRNVTCTKGRFTFTFTTGRAAKVGSCVAQRGPRGLRGFIGVRGPRGATGTVSVSQIVSVATRVLAGYCAAHHRCQGPPGKNGNRGARGPRGLRGPEGPRGKPGENHGGHGHDGGPGPHRIRQLLCLVVPCHQ